jgi:hypothetical protein
VVKTHAGPTRLVRLLLLCSMIRALVIVRDPRDIILSAMDHGTKLRGEGRKDTFASCDTIEHTLIQVKQWIGTISPWLGCGKVLIVKYEDLTIRPEQTLKHIAAFLNLSVNKGFLEEIRRKYDAQQPDPSVRNILHYNKAVANRYLSHFTPEELEFITNTLKEELALLDYPSEVLR